VLEKRKDLRFAASGVRVLPNMSKILIKWLGEKEVFKMAQRCTGTPWYEMETGQRVGYTAWRPLVMREAGGEFLLMHYQDLIQTLYDLACSAGATVDFNVAVTSISSDEPRPSVTLSNGETIFADIIIGADGPTSMTRDFILGEKESPQPQGVSAYTGTIPIADLMKTPELADWADNVNQWPIVVGTNRSMGSHIVRNRNRDEFTVALYWPDDEMGLRDNNDVSSNHELVSTEPMLAYPQLGLRLRKLLHLMPMMARERWVKGPELESWSDETQRIILVGEAAHPWIPSGNNGPSILFEDSVVLGTIFSHLRSFDQIPLFANAYEEIRQPRCQSALDKEIAAYRAVWLPPGPARDGRNAILAEGDRCENSDGENEAVLAQEMEEYEEIMAYDAIEAAEEWWVEWGRFHSFAGAEDYDQDEGLKIETRRMSFYHEEILTE